MWATLRVYLLWRCVRDYTLAQLPRRHTIAAFQHLHLGSAYAFKVPARARAQRRAATMHAPLPDESGLIRPSAGVG
jgi:hypothetical protein